ncbi:orotidine 5'-phosphate decarboxylase [Micrococcus sp. HMSC067E09]|uniref:orotidine-5'-phosphate decarboxylase n=1 Tax=Micrococcus sp. HMSC067E09 TaxID=1739367 RepID=UPI0008A0F986|nr:orotidine-5'-phosphate decarboxylase [Micrococcus sp. HMSC067E09]OFR90309.1 orotidine 5'-phosphate decarboxylase [Micrococcus sp. HMSC067E09]
MTAEATGRVGIAGRVPFGARLAAAMESVGPLCLGIDPHPGLLKDWGLDDTAAGLEAFSLTALEAAAGGGSPLVAALKPQVALYERHGSAGMAALERLLAEAREAGILTIADAKRGDIGSTMAGYAAAWLADGSALAADAVTLSPFLGFESLRPALDLAAETGRGVFVLALTSNPEGASVQHVGHDDGSAAPSASSSSAGSRSAEAARGAAGGSVAARIVAAAAAENALRAGGDRLGPVGLVVGATVADRARELGIDLSAVRGALLAPGYGAQGATAEGMRSGFADAWPAVLATSSRGILRAGPTVAGLAEALRTNLSDLQG